MSPNSILLHRREAFAFISMGMDQLQALLADRQKGIPTNHVPVCVVMQSVAFGLFIASLANLCNCLNIAFRIEIPFYTLPTRSCWQHPVIVCHVIRMLKVHFGF